MTTSPAVATLGLLAAVLLCACESVVDGSKEEFSKQFTCPVERIDAQPRPELHWSDLEPSAGPPKDIAADPERLKMWQDKNAKSKEYSDSNYTILELTGCGQHVLFACRRLQSGNRFSCWNKPFPATATTAASAGAPSGAPSASAGTPSITLATLAGAPLTSTPASMTPPPIVGTYEAFDVRANYDWASSVAAAWSRDAKLYRAHASHVPFDGKVNLASPQSVASVELYFNSQAKGDVDLQMEVSPLRDRRAPRAESGVLELRVSPHRDTTKRDPVPRPWCNLDQAIATLRTTRALATAQPAYGVDANLLIIAGKAYWHLLYTDATGKGVAADVSMACAIEHPQ